MIFSLLTTAVGALFGGGLLGSLVAGAVVMGAKYLLNQYLNRKKKRAYSAVAGESQIGGTVPVSTLFGLGKVAQPHRIYYAKYGGGDKYNAEVFRLAHGWCDGLEPYVYFYGQKFDLVERPIVGTEVKHYGVSGFDNLISIRFYDGRPGQIADAKLVADTATLGQPWKATSVCTGMTYIVVEREWTADKFAEGKPYFEFVLRGLREYDPRKDSTVAGGSGSQRIGDMSTWTHTTNPAVHRLNYQLGLRGRVSGRTLIGEGKSLGQLDLSSYFVAMNVCDTVRDNGKPTYACSIWVNSADDHTEILKELDDAMAGYTLNRRGLSGVLVGAPQIAVFDLTSNDIDVRRAARLQLRKSGFDLYNQLSGQFTSIEKKWEAESLKPIVVNADVAADGRARGTSNDFLQVTDPDIAQYLLTIRYRQNRKGGTATVPVSRRAGLAVMEGEWITYAARTWILSKASTDDDFRFTWELAETGADVYSGDDIEPGPIVVPVPPQVSLLASTVQDFRVEVGLLKGTDGYEQPTLRFTWTPPADPTITAVRFFYFIGNDPTGQTIYEDQTTGAESGLYVTSKNVQSGVFYTARATITTVPDRFKTFTPWKTTVEPTGNQKVYPAGMVDEINDRTDLVLTPLNVNIRDLIEQERKNVLAMMNQDAGQYLDQQQSLMQVKSVFGTVTADYEELVTAMTGPTSAIVQQLVTFAAIIPTLATATALQSTALRVSSLEGVTEAQGNRLDIIEVTLPGKASVSSLASVGLVATDGGGNITGVGTAITGIQAAVNDSLAQGMFRTYVEATETGALSTIGISASATSGGPTSQAAILISALANGKSMIGLLADLIYFRDIAGSKQYPFAFSDGVLRANIGYFGTIYSARLQHPDGKFIIDLDNKFWSMSF